MNERSRPSKIRSVIGAYCQGFRDEDLDAICRLYAEDATIEDPAGTPKKCGMSQIREFYADSMQFKPQLRITGDPVIVGGFSATPLIVDVESDGQSRAIELISVMSYNKQNKITSMTAYFDPSILDM